MPSRKWRSHPKRARDVSIREQEALLDALDEEQTTEQSELRIYREVDSGSQSMPKPVQAYPFRFGGDPFPYYRYTPYIFGNEGQGTVTQEPPTHIPTQKSSKSGNKKAGQQMSQKRVNVTQKAGVPEERPHYGVQHPQPYPYYYPYPSPYGYPGVYGSYVQPNPHPYPYAQPQPLPGQQPLHVPVPFESDDDSSMEKSGVMTIEGRRPLFLVALFVVSIAVLLVSFPLTLLSAGYIGPLGLVFATGPFATVFAFWAIYLTPCECYPNLEWATSRIRVFATAAAVMDAIGTIGIPISMYGAQCPDDDDLMLGCEDELPAAKGISLAVAVVMGTHCFLCLLVRSNARKLAESKFGDTRTEGITLTPTPLDRF